MEKLQETFIRKGIKYKLYSRTATHALFEQSMKIDQNWEVIGYEVAKIRFQEEQMKNNIHFKAKELIPSDEIFGTESPFETKSQAFSSDGLQRALNYMSKIEFYHLGKVKTPTIS
jgi:hypothetical protein